MRIKYFEDTDTALLEIGNSSAAETYGLSEDVALDFDAEGYIVSITVEHASLRGDLFEISFERLGSTRPAELKSALSVS